MDVNELTAKICLSLVIEIPKAIAKDGFVRFIELENVIKPILEKALKESKHETDCI